MNRNTIIIWLVLAIVLGLVLVFGGDKQKKSDERTWRPTYERNDKYALGSYALHELFSQELPNKNKITLQTAYNTLENEGENNIIWNEDTEQKKLHLDYDSKQPTTYFVFNENIDFNSLDLEYLDYFLAKKNHNAFIAAHTFGEEFRKHFYFDMSGQLYAEIGNQEANLDVNNYQVTTSLVFPEAPVGFVNPALSGYKYKAAWKKVGGDFHFSRINGDNTTVVATDSSHRPTMIRIDYPEGGSLFLSCQPELLTNYYVLHKDSRKFAEGVFTLLNPQNVIWDEYYKDGNLRRVAEGGGDIMRYVMAQPALSWALWISLIGMAFYVLFEIKRRQRIIPILKTPENATLEFTTTIGRLFYQSRDHKNVAEKKIRYFLEHLRTHYYLKTQEMDDEFVQNLSAKSGQDKTLVQSLVRKILYVRRNNQISENDLIDISAQIDNFYQLQKN